MEQQSRELRLERNSFDYFRLFASIQVMLGHMLSLYEVRLPAYIPLHFVGGGAGPVYTMRVSRNSIL